MEQYPCRRVPRRGDPQILLRSQISVHLVQITTSQTLFSIPVFCNDRSEFRVDDNTTTVRGVEHHISLHRRKNRLHSFRRHRHRPMEYMTWTDDPTFRNQFHCIKARHRLLEKAPHPMFVPIRLRKRCCPSFLGGQRKIEGESRECQHDGLPHRCDLSDPLQDESVLAEDRKHLLDRNQRPNRGSDMREQHSLQAARCVLRAARTNRFRGVSSVSSSNRHATSPASSNRFVEVTSISIRPRTRVSTSSRCRYPRERFRRILRSTSRIRSLPTRSGRSSTSSWTLALKRSPKRAKSEA